jgi:hypothetical protein
MKCTIKPMQCKDKICKQVFGVGKGRDRLVHKVCDSIPSVNGATDSCAMAVAKCAGVGLCLALRKLETIICFGGKKHRPGDKSDIEDQTERQLQNCIKKARRICTRECFE